MASTSQAVLPSLPAADVMFSDMQCTCQELRRRGLKYAASFLSELLLSVSSRLDNTDDDNDARCDDNDSVETFRRFHAELMNQQRFPAPPPPPTSTTIGSSTFLHQSDDKGSSAHVHLQALLERIEERWPLPHSDDDSVAVADPPCDSYALWLRGVVVRKLGRLDQAYSLFCDALALRPYNWAAWVELADLLLLLPRNASTTAARGRRRPSSCTVTLPPAELVASFLPWPALQKKTTAALGPLFDGSLCGRLLFVQLLRLLRDYDGAARELDALRDSVLDEHCPPVMHWTAQTLALQQRFAESYALYEQIRQRHPFRLDGLDSLAYQLYQQPNDELLDRLARDAIRINRTAPETYVIVGVYLLRKGHAQQAVLHLDRALRIAPNSPQAWFLLGRTLLEYDGKTVAAKAVDCFFRATRLNPYMSEAWLALADIYPRRLRRFAEHYRELS